MAPAPQPRPEALSIPKYMLKASESMRFKDDPDSLQYIRFGYFGEIGGLLSSVKKAGRDHLLAAQNELAAEELGDALWYLTMAAHLMGVTGDGLGEQCLLVLRQEFGESSKTPTPPITFRQIDGLIDTQRDGDTITRPTQLGKLALSAGALAERAHASLDALGIPQREAYFGQLLSELAKTCSSFNLTLEDVAHGNLEKTASRWPGEQTRDFPLFDEGFPEHEQFEREFTIEFIERGEGQNKHVVQRLNGVYIGDRLTDNSNARDDYRFHDVFHLAYVAYLGWSPVLRALLKRKRKSNPTKDETDDGARAAIIEEGIATWIFDHAKKHDYYEGIQAGQLNYGLLKQIQGMVRDYEVERCKLWQWELAILEGFKMFRQLRAHRGGSVTVNMNEGTLIFHKPPQEAETK